MADMVSADVLGLTAQIVAAHVGHNEVAADALTYDVGTSCGANNKRARSQ